MRSGECEDRRGSQAGVQMKWQVKCEVKVKVDVDVDVVRCESLPHARSLVC